MKLLRILATKPWLPTELDDPSPALALGPNKAAIASTMVWFYMAVATVMFSIVVVAYVLRLGNYGADPQAAAEALSSMAWWTLAAICGIPPADDWQPMAEPGLLWFNSALLVASSLAWHVAGRSARRADLAALRRMLIAAGALALMFLIGQLTAWQMLIADGQMAASNPASSFFYLITAMHGAHLIGGLFFWGRTTRQALSGASADQLASGVRLCGLYWHYLLLIWALFFILLLIT